MEPFSLPPRLRPDNPEFADAAGFLYGGPEAKAAVVRDKGETYPVWVLDKLGIETMLANRVAMGRGLASPRFLWVPFADALMYPRDNARAKGRSPDDKGFMEAEERLLARYVAEAELAALPRTFKEYLSFVTATLQRHRAQGAVAEKFETAYLRSLDISRVDEASAAAVFARRGAVSDADYKRLQDFLFRYIARECGRLGMAVHIHVGAGAGGSFRNAGTGPLLLDDVLNDRELRATRFVLVHGGFPQTRDAAILLTKPNVWLDFSAQTFLESPSRLAVTLREYLSFAPEKILYGTDAFPLVPPAVGWEETAHLSDKTARAALAKALSGMLRDGEITRPRALELARLVLRDNARALYGWEEK